MTKEDFKKKYHGKSIEIKQSMSEIVQRIGGVVDRIKEICEFMELKTYQIAPSSSYPLITIIDRQQEFKTIDEPPILIDEQEFLSDFKETYAELQFGKAKKLLLDFKIEYEEIRKSSKTLKDIMNIGFIQAQTSDEASLWWHPDGKRIFFVRGQGAFSLIDKKKLINMSNSKEKKEYLLCAAIRRVEEKDCPKAYWEQYHDIYKCELGWRHPDIIHKFGNEVSKEMEDQGFYTSKGRFVTREEGLLIAREAGQVDEILGGVLTSEDLY